MNAARYRPVDARCPSAGSAGFSLLELMVVMTILAVSAGVVVPRIGGNLPESPVGVTADELAQILRSARRTALSEATPVLATLDRDTGRWWVSVPARDDALREGRVDLTSGVSLRAGSQRVVYRFSPDGEAISEPLTVTGPTGSVRIDVDPWTGVVRVS